MQNNANNLSQGETHPRRTLTHTADRLKPVPTSAAASPHTGANTISSSHRIQSPSQAYGYGDSALEGESHIDPHLGVQASTFAAADNMQRAISPGSEEPGPIPGTSAAGMAAQGLVGHDPDDAANDGRKAKRELSQSKRAAQNRAAQRAFRQRKEHYIKKLEQQVREYVEMEHNYKLIQNDNYALREYVIQLQSRLLDLRQDLPPAPPNINLNHQPEPPVNNTRTTHPLTAGPTIVSAPAPAPALTAAAAPAPAAAAGPAAAAPPPPPQAPTGPHESGPGGAAAGTLADVAAAVAGLRARDPPPEGLYPKNQYKAEPTEDQQAGEEIRRQLQQEGGLPPPSSLRA